jgi:hypothetical protein
LELQHVAAGIEAEQRVVERRRQNKGIGTAKAGFVDLVTAASLSCRARSICDQPPPSTCRRPSTVSRPATPKSCCPRQQHFSRLFVLGVVGALPVPVDGVELLFQRGDRVVQQPGFRRQLLAGYMQTFARHRVTTSADRPGLCAYRERRAGASGAIVANPGSARNGDYRNADRRGGEMNGRGYSLRLEGAKYGVSFGTALAIAISYTNNHSIVWAIIDGFLSWVYVVFFALFRA